MAAVTVAVKVAVTVVGREIVLTGADGSRQKRRTHPERTGPWEELTEKNDRCSVAAAATLEGNDELQDECE